MRGQGANIETKRFDVFCPKVLAGIGKLPDTIKDRSIPIELKRKSSAETVDRFRQRLVKPEAEQIRRQLERWAAAHVPTLSSSATASR